MSSLFGRLADVLEAAENDWSVLARPNQLPPPGDWRIWLLLAGRGFGKTRTLCEWVRAQVESGAAGRIALVAPTAADARDVLIEGPAGLLEIAPAWNRPIYEPSKRRLTWPNGAMATAYSADEPERLRGPQHDCAVADELATWRYPEAWDQLHFGLRIGKNPRCVVATTPKPVKILRDLIAREGADVVITRGATIENAANLAATFISQITARYGGTRLGRQELNGEMLDDVPGALWTRETIEASRVSSAPTHLQRVVIAIDPAGSTTEGADITGIIAAGIGADGEGYVLADLSGRYAPTDWARRAIAAFHSLKADKIVVERNYGGDMAAATLASVDAGVPVKEISSSRGKTLRAEPVASLFEQRRAHIAGTLPELEDQMAAFTSDWDRARDGSPDRVDAMVFALTELMLGQPLGGFFHEQLFLQNGAPIELPQHPDWVFAVAAAPSRSAPEQDSIGVVYLATSPHPEVAPPVTILDYDLREIDGPLLETWLPTVFEKLASFTQQCKARHGCAGLWTEERGIGAALLQQDFERGFDMHDLDTQLDLPPSLDDRVSYISPAIHSSKVKIARPAYECLLAHRGVTRNHLLAQLLGFRPGADVAESAELLAALCAAVAISNPLEQGRRRKRA